VLLSCSPAPRGRQGHHRRASASPKALGIGTPHAPLPREVEGDATASSPAEFEALRTSAVRSAVRGLRRPQGHRGPRWSGWPRGTTSSWRSTCRAPEGPDMTRGRLVFVKPRRRGMRRRLLRAPSHPADLERRLARRPREPTPIQRVVVSSHGEACPVALILTRSGGNPRQKDP
jgi:hypothetical protein